MGIVFYVLAKLCSLYLLLLFLRVVLSWVQLFAHHWRPRGVLLVAANVIYALTDPPIKAVGRYVRPVSLGGIGLDVGFLVVLIAVLVLERVFLALAVSVW